MTRFIASLVSILVLAIGLFLVSQWREKQGVRSGADYFTQKERADHAEKNTK